MPSPKEVMARSNDTSAAVASGPHPNKTQEQEFEQLICFMVSYLRGLETARDDSVCYDPFAEQLTRQIAPRLDPHVERWRKRQPALPNYVALLSRFVDEALEKRNPEIRQVVIVGSGLDARAYYLESLEGCHVFEIEQSAELLEHKQAVIEELDVPLVAERHDCIVADLADVDWDEKLLSSGFDPSVPTYWVLEDLLVYVDPSTIVELFKTINIISAPGSEIWGDVPGTVPLQTGELSYLKDLNALRMAEVGQCMFKFGEDVDPLQGIFSELSWQLDLQASLLEPGIHFGREWLPMVTGGSKVPVPLSFVHGKKPEPTP